MNLGITDAAALRRLDRLIWAMVAAVAAIVLAAPVVSGFYIEWPSFAAPVLVALALSAAAWFYRTRRSDPSVLRTEHGAVDAQDGGDVRQALQAG